MQKVTQVARIVEWLNKRRACESVGKGEHEELILGSQVRATPTPKQVRIRRAAGQGVDGNTRPCGRRYRDSQLPRHAELSEPVPVVGLSPRAAAELSARPDRDLPRVETLHRVSGNPHVGARSSTASRNAGIEPLDTLSGSALHVHRRAGQTVSWAAFTRISRPPERPGYPEKSGSCARSASTTRGAAPDLYLLSHSKASACRSQTSRRRSARSARCKRWRAAIRQRRRVHEHGRELLHSAPRRREDGARRRRVDAARGRRQVRIAQHLRAR